MKRCPGRSGRCWNPLRKTLSAFPAAAGNRCQTFSIGGRYSSSSRLISCPFQDSRAKYGKFVRPSRGIEEPENNLKSGEAKKVFMDQTGLKVSLLTGKHQEEVEAVVKGFGQEEEAGEKSRWASVNLS